MIRALIADDDPFAASLVSLRLRSWGIDSVTAPDGAAAWDLLAADPTTSLAIVDWMMPRVNGLELCRRIRQDPAHAHMYVILLTGRDKSEDMIMGLDAGADDYIVKPFRPGELRARISAGVRVLSLQTRLAEQVGDLQHALSHVKRLSGLMPICSYCKRIRSDANYWQQVETYITEHTDAQFSHSICPPCFDAVMAQMDAIPPSKPRPSASRILDDSRRT